MPAWKKKTEIPCRIEHSCRALVMWNNQITHSIVSFPFFIVLPRQVVICRGLSESKLQLAFSNPSRHYAYKWTTFNQLGIWQWQIISRSAILDTEFLSCLRLFSNTGRSLTSTALSAREQKSRVCIKEKEYFRFQRLTHAAVISLEGLRPRKLPSFLSHCSQGCFSFFHQLFII